MPGASTRPGRSNALQSSGSRGAGASEFRLVAQVGVPVSSILQGLARMLIGPGRFPRPGRPESPDIPRCSRLRVRWGRIQRVAQSCQRGVVLSGGESWSAGWVIVSQHPSASAGFPEGIQVDGPLLSSSVAPELPGTWPFPQCRSVRGLPAGNAAPRLPRRPGLQADG